MAKVKKMTDIEKIAFMREHKNTCHFCGWNYDQSTKIANGDPNKLTVSEMKLLSSKAQARRRMLDVIYDGEQFRVACSDCRPMKNALADASAPKDFVDPDQLELA